MPYGIQTVGFDKRKDAPSNTEEIENMLDLVKFQYSYGLDT